jgi:hypothetical protein
MTCSSYVAAPYGMYTPTGHALYSHGVAGF